MNIRIFLIVSMICCANFLFSQESQQKDTIETKKHFFQRIYDYFDKSNEVDHSKRFDVSFIGGPHYSSDTKLGIGLVASGLYRTDTTDLSISPSNVSLYGDFTTSGSYMLGIGGNTIFPQDRYRLNIDLFFSSQPSKYWGVGYERAINKQDYSKYTKKEIQVKLDFSKRFFKYTYLGVAAMAQHIRGSNFENKVFLNDENINNTAIGGGLILSYDSRDFIPNPRKGIFLKIEQNFYPKFLGSTSYFNRTDFNVRYYRQLWKESIIAFDFQGIFNNGNVPWSMLAQIGSSYQMRGYYQGQYRNKKLLQTQVELRQRIYQRSGAVLWAGAGNVFSDFDDFEWKETLPTFGIGYRWEFKNRVNVRIDYGIGKGQTAFYFNINEAF